MFRRCKMFLENNSFTEFGEKDEEVQLQNNTGI